MKSWHSLFLLIPFVSICAGADPAVVDSSTLTGKVMCGYQGWFTCEGDGLNLGWTHWAKNRGKPFGPGNVTIDLWPDVSEYGTDELYETGFRFADGTPARVYSSANPATIQRHFEWMREYGIDGVFLQRFANGLKSPQLLNQKNAVLKGVRESSLAAGRTYAVMYDLSGLKAGQTSVVREDWTALQEMKLTEESNYQHHEGKPVVSVWGIGFSDDRAYTLKETRELIQWLKAEGCAVMLGVPSFFREQTRDATAEPELHEILALADIISPWTVGRYRTPEEAARHGEKVWRPDVEWSKARELDFFPVVYPGFSWHNLHGGELDSIPRLGGRFLWAQVVAAKQAGAEMIYVAMFDEVDEGTAIFKCSNEPPVGEGVKFTSYHGLPADHYLWLTGQAGKLLRGEIPVTGELPAKK